MKIMHKALASRRRRGLLVGGAAAADDADQRRGRDVPVPDLLEVVLRVQQAAPERRDQLPVDRIGRRHPAADRRRRCSSAPPTAR